MRKAIVTAQRKKEDEMHALAQSLGFFCLSSTQFLLDLASRIKDATKNRGGTFVSPVGGVLGGQLPARAGTSSLRSGDLGLHNSKWHINVAPRLQRADGGGVRVHLRGRPTLLFGMLEGVQVSIGASDSRPGHDHAGRENLARGFAEW